VRSHVDLCSGIGGFSLGFIAAKLSEPVLLCDFDEKVRKLLRVRFPGIPIANDVKEIASDPKRFIRQRPFILTSGYPCQPFSASGQRKGEEDPRHIFPHIAEIVAQTRPTYCVFENVYGHISLGLDKVLSQMGSLDYTTATFIVPAAGFRPHKRDRLWIICKNMANTNNEGIWSCERGSDVDNEGFGGERGANRGGSSSHDEWNDTQTTKNERMVVANTKNSSGEQTEWERGESVGGGSVDSIWSEDQRKDIERTTDVSNTNDTRNRTSKHETERERSENIAKGQRGPQSEPSRQGADVANANSEGLQGHGQHSELERESCTKQLAKESLQRTEFRQTMSNFCGIFNGISDWLDEPRHIQRTTHKNEYRADRLKQLGNALLPQITYRIGLAIKEIEEKE
tara:strand:+ start:52 stop:1248 length:1197 start_codon:yes stop_codon:yes gene_type:complete